MKSRHFGAIAMIGLLVAACSSGGSGASSSARVSIEFLSVQRADQGWPLVLSQITSSFAKTHPGSTFKVDYVATPSELNQKIQLLGAQKALPVLYNTPPPDLLSPLARNGQLLDLEPALKQLGVYSQVDPVAVNIDKKLNGGKLYGLPFELNIEGFWYNKKIFADNGLQPPRTWDDLVQDAATLQQKGIQPFSASGTQGWPITRLISGYLFRELGPAAMDNIKNGKAKLTDPDYLKAAQAVADLGKKGYFGNGVATLDYDPAVDVFLQGKAAMFYMGSWELRDFNDPARNKIGQDDIGFFPFPTVTGGKGTADQTPMNAGQMTSVSKARYSPAVGQWLAAVARSYGGIALTKEGAITGFKVNSQTGSLPALTTMVRGQISQTSQPVTWFEALFSTKATNVSQQDAALLVTGAMSPDDFMQAVQQAQ